MLTLTWVHHDVTLAFHNSSYRVVLMLRPLRYFYNVAHRRDFNKGLHSPPTKAKDALARKYFFWQVSKIDNSYVPLNKARQCVLFILSWVGLQWKQPGEELENHMNRTGNSRGWWVSPFIRLTNEFQWCCPKKASVSQGSSFWYNRWSILNYFYYFIYFQMAFDKYSQDRIFY